MRTTRLASIGSAWRNAARGALPMLAPLVMASVAQGQRMVVNLHPAGATESWAYDVWEQASALSPDDRSRAAKLNSAAWELLTVTPETLRDPAVALEFAIKANDVSRYEVPNQLDTLALAYHRTGETAKAIELQTKAISLLPADASRSEYEDRLREYEAASQSAVDKREK
jgi:hypothetical protein